MDCHAHAEAALQQNLIVDDLLSLVTECPQLCDYVYGTSDFAFAGTGVFVSFATQAILYVIFGTLLSFISYILSPHAKSSTRLMVARLQVIFDTVYSTGTMIHLATLIATFLRLRQDAGAFERNSIQSIIDIQAVLQGLALIAYTVQRGPAEIKMRVHGWGSGSVFLTSQLLIMAGHYLKASSGRVPGAAITKICRASAPADYPYIATPPSGNSYLLLFIATIMVTILLIVANEYIRSTIWTWIKKIFGSRITVSIFVTVWTLVTLTALGLNYYVFFRERDMMFAKTGSGAPAWDFGQVFVLVIWLPTAWLMVLTFLLSLKGINAWLDLFLILVHYIYDLNVGMEPRIEKDEGDGDRQSSPNGILGSKDKNVEQMIHLGGERMSLAKVESGIDAKTPLRAPTDSGDEHNKATEVNDYEGDNGDVHDGYDEKQPML